MFSQPLCQWWYLSGMNTFCLHFFMVSCLCLLEIFTNCILPFLLYAGIRHLLFSQKNFKSHPYYELQVGGANIGIFVGLLLGIILNIGIGGLSCILLIYDILVISKSLVHFKYSGINEGLKFIPFILIISYFVYLGFKIRG